MFVCCWWGETTQEKHYLTFTFYFLSTTLISLYKHRLLQKQTQSCQLQSSLPIKRPFNLSREGSRNAYLLAWRVYASRARPSLSVKCAEWELQSCVIIIIIKFRVACTLFIITWRRLISFTLTDLADECLCQGDGWGYSRTPAKVCFIFK